VVYRQSVRLGNKPLETRRPLFFFSTEHFRSQSLCNILSYERMGSVVYNCCWSSPAQSFSGLNPSGLMTRFYCLRFETPPTWRARSPYLYSSGTGWPTCTQRHWVPFCRLGMERVKTQLLIVILIIAVGIYLFAKSLLSNGFRIFAYSEVVA
jgi:hypothetical protein